MKHLCETWKEHAPNGDPPICFYGDMKHGVYFYTGSQIQRMTKRSRFADFVAPEKRAFCIVERTNFSTLRQQHRKAHPKSDLTIVNDTHLEYVLISNFQVEEPAKQGAGTD
jgi:hypothetical protein